jgi:hypothetical protein
VPPPRGMSKCPVCFRNVMRANEVMCAEDWARLPRDLQRAHWREYRRSCASERHPTAEFCTSLDRVIAKAIELRATEASAA